MLFNNIDIYNQSKFQICEIEIFLPRKHGNTENRKEEIVNFEELCDFSLFNCF